MSTVQDCGFKLIDHPPYSTDLVPSDYFPLQTLTKHLVGKRHDSDADAISTVDDFSEGKEENFYATGIRAVWTAEEIMLKNKLSLVKFRYFVLVRQ